MRQKVFLMTSLMVAVTLVLALGRVPTSSAVQTDDLLAGRPRLDSYKVYFSEASGEASRFDRSANGLSRLAGLLQQLGAQTYTLEWRYPIPDDASLIVIAGPVTDLSGDQTARLWSYLNHNGRLLLLVQPIMQKVKALPSDGGLFQLTWNDMGIRALDDMIVKEGELKTVTGPADVVEAGTPTPTPYTVEAPVLIPSFTSSSFNPDHPIMQGLEGGLTFFSARSLEVDSAPGVSQAVALAFSASDYYGETDLRTYVDSGYSTYDENDAPRGELPVAGASLNPATGARVVLIGDRLFATNGGGLQSSPPSSPSFLYPDNIRFLLNAVAWLLDVPPAQDTAFPTPGATATQTVTPTITLTPSPTVLPSETPLATPTQSTSGS